MANIPIAIAIVVAAVIIVLGFGYFTANPKILETTTIPTTSVQTTTTTIIPTNVVTVTEAEATSLVLQDLQSAAPPNTMINIKNVTPSTYQGSWHILVSVVNATSSCIYSFDYPKFGFVYRVVNCSI